jgi:hypothetical protein
MRLTELVGSRGSSANDREEIRFAKDSPVEEAGFEPPVPRDRVALSGGTGVAGAAALRFMEASERSDNSALDVHLGSLGHRDPWYYRGTLSSRFHLDLDHRAQDRRCRPFSLITLSDHYPA